jgi:hypothetical protein
MLQEQPYHQWLMRLFPSGPNNHSLIKFIVLNPKVFKEYITTVICNGICNDYVNIPNQAMTSIHGVCIITTMSSTQTLSDIKLKV